ncbi:GFA family protein [Oleiphilus sp. HI0080]|uniref:GFA family protein n=1 Tax=Oleiphilus sp. HI0080 TaxID=1822255 RepID=UPI0009ED8D1E|nr:GFA family protein [Oleiphilus sp. HI0080]
MNKPYQGSCMCGVVQFSFTGPALFVADCVCASCRQAHGASAVTWVGVKSAHFTVDAGIASLRWYQSSQESERGFCTDCGTRMFFRSSKWPGEMHMTVANIALPHDLIASSVSFEQELPAWTAMSVKKHTKN